MLEVAKNRPIWCPETWENKTKEIICLSVNLDVIIIIIFYTILLVIYNTFHVCITLNYLQYTLHYITNNRKK